VAVSRDSDSRDGTEREAVERHLNFARNLHIEARMLQGSDVAKTLVEFARLNGITHLFLARPRQSQWPAAFRKTIVQQVVRLASDMQVIIVADRGRSHPSDRPQPTA
jgi:K+-sensing histidine kinase KdpD